MNIIVLGRKYVLFTPITFTRKGWCRSVSYYRNKMKAFQSLNCTRVSPLTFTTNLNPKAFVCASVLEVNTKVVKDVILYRYDNPKFFRIVNIFALCQFGFWTYLSHFAFTTLKDAPVPNDTENLPWWRRINLGENKYRNTLTVLSFLIGYGILTAACLFTLKSVRYLILRKGGDKLTFVTYTPFGKNRMMTVDVNKVSSEESRQNARVQLPIKVKGYHLYFVLDMRGEFRNPKLFDSTAGLKRVWRN